MTNENHNAATRDQLWSLWRLLLSALLDELKSDKPHRASMLAVAAAFLKDNGVVIDPNETSPKGARERAIERLELLLPFGSTQ